MKYKQMKKINFLFILTIFCTQLFAQSSSPNILLIIVDDLGIDGLEGFGVDINNFPNTPKIQALQNNGLTYRNTWATPQCTPTRAAIIFSCLNKK